MSALITVAESLDTVLDYPVKNGAYRDRHGETHELYTGPCKRQMIRMAILRGWALESFLDHVFLAPGTVTVEELMAFHDIAERDMDDISMTARELEHDDFINRHGRLASLWWKKIEEDR